MAEMTVTTNGKDKQDKGVDEVRFGHSESVIKDREKMEAELETKVIKPLALLAGLLANVKEDEEDSGALSTLGYLLGLLVNGIRKEVSFQVYGLDKEALMGMILQKGFEQEEFGKEGAA